MKRLMISAFAVVALFAATTATAMLWSPSTKRSAGTAAMPALQELHTAAGVNKLPIEEFEDQSLVYPTVTKRWPGHPQLSARAPSSRKTCPDIGNDHHG